MLRKRDQEKERSIREELVLWVCRAREGRLWAFRAKE